MGIFFAITFCVIVFIYLFKTVFEYYLQYSKKYKNFHIVDKVSKIADKNKAIVILDGIVGIFQFLIFMQFAVFILLALGIALFDNTTDTLKLCEELIQLLVYLTIVEFCIWTCSMLVTSIYYIIVYMKEIKITKKIES